MTVGLKKGIQLVCLLFLVEIEMEDIIMLGLKLDALAMHFTSFTFFPLRT